MMRRLVRVMPLLAILLVAASGCKSLTGETIGENIDDTNVTTSVKVKLAAQKGVTLTRVHVQTRKGVVYLTGSVDDPALKDRAGEIARSVAGVRDVINSVKVER